MKKFVSTSVLLLATCAFTFAGNERYPSKEPVVELPTCAQFGGFDLGINVGGAVHDWTWNDRDNWTDNFGDDFEVSSLSKTRSGVTLGGSAGYNWQKGCALFGLMADGSWTSIDGHLRASPESDSDEVTLHIHDDLNFWGTARARSGVIVDNLLLYVTGGFAFADIGHHWTVTEGLSGMLSTSNPQAPSGDGDEIRESFSADSFRWGGVAGVGAEWALNRNWSLRTEYLYVLFTEEHTSGDSEGTQKGASIDRVHFDTQDSMFVSRFALVYRFGGGR